MTKKEHIDKKDFIYLHLAIAENSSYSGQVAKEYLESENIDTQKLLSDGIKRIRKLQLLLNAKRTEEEMLISASVKAEAIKWVEKLLNNVDFSLQDIVREEELTVSFRNMENLSQEDIRAILIRHFTLKLLNQKKNDKK
jgi:hypothetical protein